MALYDNACTAAVEGSEIFSYMMCCLLSAEIGYVSLLSRMENSD